MKTKLTFIKDTGINIVNEIATTKFIFKVETMNQLS